MKIKLWHILGLVTVLFAFGTVVVVIVHNEWSQAADSLSAIGLVATVATICVYFMEE